MAQLFADLHCHPGLYAFNRMRNQPRMEQDPQKFHPWHQLDSNLDHMREGRRAAEYSQCNLAQMHASKTRLVFASITPIERGFFQGAKDELGNFVPELFKLLSGVTVAQSATQAIVGDHFAAARKLLGVARNRGPVRALLHRAVLKYSMPRVRFMLSEDYDYWEEFEREYDFFLSRHDQQVDVDWQHAAGAGIKRRRLTGRYRMIDGADALEQVIEGDEDDLAMLMSIEGGHVFSMGPDGERVDADVIFERIDRLKSLPYPIFYLTLAHHFDNGICGHAHSLIDAAKLVMDQTPRMHEGFEREDDLGLRVVREVLDLDEDLTDRGGRRILLDTRHMSPQTRKEYYDEVVRPYNERHDSKSAADKKRYPKIPVISSHSAHTGVATLDDLIANAQYEDDHWHRNPYYAWGINTCDEDIRMVHSSEGLFGLSFDQRIVGVPPRQTVHPSQWPYIMLNQIFGVVDVVMQDERLSADERLSMWDRVCIGTDFDGMIDPVTRYPTAMDLPTFADDLRELLWQHRHTRMIERVGVDELVEKIAWKNAYDFARRHLPSVCAK